MNGQCTDPEAISDYAFYGEEDGSVTYLGSKVDSVDNFDNEFSSSFFLEGKTVYQVKFNPQEETACIKKVAPGTRLKGLKK
jgi:hypothetical protein